MLRLATNESGEGQTMAEAEFLTDIVADGMLEEELGRMATAKGFREEIRRFGRHLMSVRSEVGRDATDLAARKGIDVPQELNQDYRTLIARLDGLEAAEFDEQCIRTVLREHEKTVSQLLEDVQGISDPEVRSFAEKAFETVEEHFESARRVASQVL
jgi:putative membrane protein